MQLATWNVNNGSVDERLVELNAEFDVDVVAMQESATPDGDSNYLWDGDLAHKGVSLSSEFLMKQVVVDGETSPCLAARVLDSPFGEFNVLNLWAKPKPSYFADLTRTIDLYSSFIRERPTVIVGDFNMSVRIASKGRQFDLLNARLNHDSDLFSAYHEYTHQGFGMETMTTLYYMWGASRCFHCDFIYIPGEWISRIKKVSVPGFKQFATSDHRPVICELV